MILTRVLPSPSERLDTDDPAARTRLLDFYAPPTDEWLRINLVSSVSGSAVGVDGTSETLTSRSDRAILGVIRQLADVVLIGAASVRAERFVVPRRSRLAVITATGDLSGHRIAADQLDRVIVVCGASVVGSVRSSLGDVDVLLVGSEEGPLSADAAIGALRTRGLKSIVCEGGPSLAAQLVTAGLVDEVCVTSSPVLNGGALPAFGSAEFAPVPLTLTQLMHDDAGFLFTRWSS